MWVAAAMPCPSILSSQIKCPPAGTDAHKGFAVISLRFMITARALVPCALLKRRCRRRSVVHPLLWINNIAKKLSFFEACY